MPPGDRQFRFTILMTEQVLGVIGSKYKSIVLALCCNCDTITNMSKTAVINARIEPQTKRKAEKILKKLGMTPTEAIRLFYTQIYLREGLPFAVSIPNDVTRKTLDKSDKGDDVKCFDSLEEMYESWEK